MRTTRKGRLVLRFLAACLAHACTKVGQAASGWLPSLIDHEKLLAVCRVDKLGFCLQCFCATPLTILLIVRWPPKKRQS
ncbi:hypothetical protein POJ06DRAFT_259267 [Lipomyces tetrasporus]|uniref:Secreted protein n=1 Tax=Lipomyces tetrasporus TaxID=54092 RepID=A0AAD7QP56_9ASCO|nr:uncharacterized protein POJ06DRAFT_259267 [Lipomyces tetrasporus]KAJ8098361.1 hypothetical protein POJ06DRAFT_259267 [Lipomyces tetrasporus]